MVDSQIVRCENGRAAVEAHLDIKFHMFPEICEVFGRTTCVAAWEDCEAVMQSFIICDGSHAQVRMLSLANLLVVILSLQVNPTQSSLTRVI